MSHHFSETEAVAAISRLTRARLVSFIELEIVSPVHTEAGLRFRQVDLVRMELLCELSEDFDLKDDALGVVISLIDQVHDARRDLKSVLNAVGLESQSVQARVISALRGGDTG